MRVLLFLFFVVLAFSFLGCSSASKEIKAKLISERTDVFHEVRGEGRMPSQGSADLVIKAQVKTNLEGFYILESKNSPHGKPKYSFLFNIDGQSVVWEAKRQKEDASFYDGQPDWGEGMRYVLEKRIRLAPGYHRIFFALPGDDYFKEFGITLKGNELTVLELNPIYKTEGRNSRPCLLNGVKDFEIFLNGEKVW
jgi:hypothetical protein